MQKRDRSRRASNPANIQPQLWPWMYGDNMNVPATTPNDDFSVTGTLYTYLTQWAEWRAGWRPAFHIARVLATHGYVRTSPTRSADARSARLERFHGRDWLAVGDARSPSTRFPRRASSRRSTPVAKRQTPCFPEISRSTTRH